jgi:hypothetical protein
MPTELTPEQYQALSTRGQNLKNRHIVLSADHYLGNDIQRVFKCEDGFGLNPEARGTAITGTWVYDGDLARISRFEIERFATEEEIEAAKELFARKQEQDTTPRPDDNEVVGWLVVSTISGRIHVVARTQQEAAEILDRARTADKTAELCLVDITREAYRKLRAFA